MTIADYSAKYGKKIETVLKWIYDGLIPMASVDNDYVPNSAREPYFSNAKKTDAILKSIVKASINLKHVCPKTYDLCNDEFLGYINQLVRAGLITERNTDGVTYYDATILAIEDKNGYLLKAIKQISSGIAQGVMTAIINS